MTGDRIHSVWVTVGSLSKLYQPSHTATYHIKSRVTDEPRCHAGSDGWAMVSRRMVEVDRRDDFEPCETCFRRSYKEAPNGDPL